MKGNIKWSSLWQITNYLKFLQIYFVAFKLFDLPDRARER